LKIADTCPSCALDFTQIRSDDIPAYFTIAIVGHIILPLIVIAEIHYAWSMGLHMAIWPAATIFLTLLFLPRIKGIAMAILWKVKWG
jgi:uncharacterized protein (DUF983 family)